MCPLIKSLCVLLFSKCRLYTNGHAIAVVTLRAKSVREGNVFKKKSISTEKFCPFHATGGLPERHCVLPVSAGTRDPRG